APAARQHGPGPVARGGSAGRRTGRARGVRRNHPPDAQDRGSLWRTIGVDRVSDAFRALARPLDVPRTCRSVKPLPTLQPNGATAAPLAIEDVPSMQREVRALAAERNAVILAHNYQLPEVQDVADVVGDSLGLSRQAAATDADTIVFCGVHFMAETASILSPERTVLIPDLGAGCSLASSITAEQLRAWKAEHPGAVVVSYVNTTAEVKAETDICCTSSNAVEVVNAIPADREILFLPDLFLGLWLERVTGRKLRIWLGECHVHAGIRPRDIEYWQREA